MRGAPRLRRGATRHAGSVRASLCSCARCARVQMTHDTPHPARESSHHRVRGCSLSLYDLLVAAERPSAVCVPVRHYSIYVHRACPMRRELALAEVRGGSSQVAACTPRGDPAGGRLPAASSSTGPRGAVGAPGAASRTRRRSRASRHARHGGVFKVLSKVKLAHTHPAVRYYVRRTVCVK